MQQMEMHKLRGRCFEELSGKLRGEMLSATQNIEQTPSLFVQSLKLLAENPENLLWPMGQCDELQ